MDQFQKGYVSATLVIFVIVLILSICFLEHVLTIREIWLIKVEQEVNVLELLTANEDTYLMKLTLIIIRHIGFVKPVGVKESPVPEGDDMSSVIEGLTPTILAMNDAFFLPYVLESLRGRFSRYIIYDAGSEDGTENIIDWFCETEKDAEFFVRKLPFAVPPIQGVYRNSMLVEAETEWTIMVDADEVYHPSSLDMLWSQFGLINSLDAPLYGVFKRVEMASNLLHRYTDERTHHRLYRRSAYFRGSHPGEVPVHKQRPNNEFHFSDVTCYHFHNALRSPLEGSVPKRLDRKAQGTYHPGELVPFNLLETLPMLREPINGFAVSPDLEKLQHDAKQV